MSVAVAASSFGPVRPSPTLSSEQASNDREGARARDEAAARRRRAEGANCFAFCGGAALIAEGAAVHHRGARPLGGGGRGKPARCALMRPPPCRAARPRSRRTSGTTRAARRACPCRRSRRCRARGLLVRVDDARHALRDDDHRGGARALGGDAARSRASVATSSAEKASSNRNTRGRRSRARAIDSRWRWPPETFVPPYPIGESSFAASPRAKSRACAAASAAQSCSSFAAGVAVAQVRGHRAGEQEGPLRHEPDARPHRVESEHARRHRRAGPRPSSDR